MDETLFKYVLEPGVLDVRRMQADGIYPSEERLARGPIAVFECAQEIPCNPCESACRQGYIEIGEDITRLPMLDERCTGCGLCLSSCPGLSIFVLDAAYSETEAAVTMPYELLPLPGKGERVRALDRRGREVCAGTVLSVHRSSQDRAFHSVKVAIPKAHLHEVRHLERIANAR